MDIFRYKSTGGDVTKASQEEKGGWKSCSGARFQKLPKSQKSIHSFLTFSATTLIFDENYHKQNEMDIVRPTLGFSSSICSLASALKRNDNLSKNNWLEGGSSIFITTIHHSGDLVVKVALVLLCGGVQDAEHPEKYHQGRFPIKSSKSPMI